MKMEVLAVQQQYPSQYGVLGTNKVKDWTSTLTPPPTPPQAAAKSATTTTKTTPKVETAVTATQQQATSNLPYLQKETTNKIKNSINKKSKRSSAEVVKTARAASTVAAANSTYSTYSSSSYSTQNYNISNSNNNNNNLFYCDDIDASAVSDLSARLLDELRAAKSRHLTCTEVSLPCDLTPRIAAEIIRVSAKEPCGTRGCTIYIEFEDEPNNSRRIASLRLDPDTVSTFEVYLTLRQDHRGWTALLPQFMKSLARTITISPEFTITKHKLYSPHQQRTSYSYSSLKSTMASSNSSSAAISTPTS